MHGACSILGRASRLLPGALVLLSGLAAADPLTRPPYLAPVTDPDFGSTITRIAADSGLSTSPVAGTWGGDTRHVYSKQQPWSSDQSLLVIGNNDGGSPSLLFLDGTTYQPLFGPCPGNDLYDYRWHPSPAHPHEFINVDASGTLLSWYDVTTCTRTRSWTLPITAGYGIGSGEGNPSFDGRFVAVGNDTELVVVDMDPQPPYAPWPNRRIGPVYHLPPESLLVSAPGIWTIDNVSISPSGRYVDVDFDSLSDTTSDLHRIFEVDSVTLALTPHAMDDAALRCGSFAARPDGWIFPLKHADMTLDPFDDDEDVIVGGRSCPGSGIGHLVKVRLRDGAVTPLTDPTNEASIYHVSTRDSGRPGWAYASYFRMPGRVFSDEIIAVKLDGSGTVEHWAHTHTLDLDYPSQAQPVPSPDGRRVIFASNWAEDCAPGCGSPAIVKDYVVDLTGNLKPTGRSPVIGLFGPRIEQVEPNPSARLPRVLFSLASGSPARLQLVDVAGRVRMRRDLGAPGAGRHETDLAGEATPAPGMYWLRLLQDGATAAAPVVVVR